MEVITAFCMQPHILINVNLIIKQIIGLLRKHMQNLLIRKHMQNLLMLYAQKA